MEQWVGRFPCQGESRLCRDKVWGTQKDNKPPLSEAGKQSPCGAGWLLLPGLWAGPHGAGCRGAVCLRTSVLLPLCRPERPSWVYGSWSGLHFPWLSGQVKMSPLTTLLSGNLFTSCGWAFGGQKPCVTHLHGPSPCTGLAHRTHPTVLTSQGLLSPPIVWVSGLTLEMHYSISSSWRASEVQTAPQRKEARHLGSHTW